MWPGLTDIVKARIQVDSLKSALKLMGDSDGRAKIENLVIGTKKTHVPPRLCLSKNTCTIA